MKKILLLTLLVFTISCAETKKDKKENSLTELSLLGNVKSVKSTFYDADEKFGKLEKTTIKVIETANFNESGFITKSIRKNLKDNFEYIGNYRYDENNNLLEENRAYGFFTYKYDELNRLVQMDEHSESKELKFRSINMYDDKGNCIESNTYKPNGDLHSKSIYKYDDKGNCIEYAHYKEDGSLYYKYIWKYDNKGNIIEEDEVKSMFGDKGNTTRYVYDNKNKIVKRTYIEPSGDIDYVIDYKYDEKGNIINEKSVSDSGINTYTIDYMYKYDKVGNWIEQTEISFNPYYEIEPTRTIIEREITYYE